MCSRSGAQTSSAPNRRAAPSWPRCLATHRIVGARLRGAQRGERQQPDRPRADHGDVLARLDVGDRGGVQRAGQRLDQHGVLVGQVVGHGVQLRLVRDQPLAPAAAGVAAVAGLQARPRRRRRSCAGTARAGRTRTRGTARRRAPSQPSAGWSTTRSPLRGPAAISPTTSWPGTNGVLVSAARCSEALPASSAWSEPQMPLRRGVTGSQPGPGSARRPDVLELQRAARQARAGGEVARRASACR